ncbi:MAG TPA: hypothetical protein VGJ37_14985 [Pyrinomonadaceae bacterium]|jgi:hypothetical protein
MQSLPESLKSFANRIANVAVSDDAAQMVRLLRVSGLFGDQRNPADGTSGGVSAGDLDTALGGAPAGSYDQSVGIWAPKVVNGKVSFVRRIETMPEWSYWADVARIEPKSEKLRVLLIGESVARGYLYDPVFNPAIALQKILESQFGDGNVEVIDLARTNLGFEILELAISALQMEPDVAVIFAGNNWKISDPLPSEVAEIDEAIAKHGIAGAKRVMDAQTATTARRIVREVSAGYQSKGVPLVWIIPEFNLRDWRDPITNAPYVPDGLNKKWLDLLEDAQSALHDQDFAGATLLAERMIEIDEGVCAAGFYILAECSRRANDVEGERKYLTLARDATSWDLSTETIPRPYSCMQEAVREETSKHPIQVIDLPLLFKEYLEGEIADRRLFLDYCHLSAEGIRVAMSAAAACVLRAVKRVDRSWYGLLDDRVAPSSETEAEASFLAAITNAHCSQPHELVHYFTLRALNCSRHVGQWMLNYIELQTQSSVPMRMSEAEEQMWTAGSPLMRSLLRLNKKRLDRSLLKVIVDALEEVGIEGRERVERICREEHSVTRGDTNLLDYYYCSAADQTQELIWLIRTDKRYRPDAEFYRAYWPESRFIFVGEAGCAVRLCLTCRLPQLTSCEAAIGIRLNGKPQVEIVAGSRWSTWDMDLPGEAVDTGLNEIAISWPMPELDSGEALEKARLKLLERKFPDFFPVFGEIHSFSASDGRQVSSHLPVAQTESSLVQVA